MKIIENQKYYSAKEVGLLVGRTHLTVHLWDTWSNELEERGDKRLIPEPLKLGKQKTRYWNEEDILLIQNFANNIQRGDLAEFSQRQWRKKDSDIKTDKNMSAKKMLKTIESTKELEIEDKLIYSFIFLSDKDTRLPSIEEMEKFFAFKRDVIEKSIVKLLNLRLIIKVEEHYIIYK